MKITKVLVINSKTRNKYIVDFSNKQLNELSKELNERQPSERMMVDYLDDKNIEALTTSRKYYISSSDVETNYQLKILSELISNLDHVKELKNMKDLYDENNLSYNIIGYLSEEENENKELFLYQIKKVNLVKEKSFFIFNKLVGTTPGTGVSVEQIKNGFDLPLDGCFASLYKRKDSNEGKKYKAKIYQAYLFDKIFDTSETQHKYVDRNLKKFSDSDSPIKITKDEIGVSFSNADMKVLKNKIYSDEHLTKAFANFQDNKHRKIKQISIQKLEKVLTTLKTYVKNNADAGFEKKNIPTFDPKKGELSVTEDSIPTFAALLDNKVIQRLLNNQIEIPYYKRQLKK